VLHVTLANLRAHKRRLLSSFAAVALGVAFLSGVLVQTATLEDGFDRLFDAESAEVDAVVRSDRMLDDLHGNASRPRIDPDTVDRVSAVDGVRLARADIRGSATIVGSDGDALGTFGPPTLGLTWHDDPALSPYRIAEGRPPSAPHEVVIDAASAERGDLSVGDTTTVLTPEAVPVTVVGVVRFGTADSQAGVTATLFSEAGALAHLTDGDGIDRVLVAADADADEAVLAGRIVEVAGAGTETIPGQVFRDENRSAIDDVMGFLRPVLLAFALIALVVASFSIANTFAIIVAQRTREAALLRAIGASRRQTLLAVVVEALLIGSVASLAGLGLGIGIASLLGSLFGSMGMDLGGGLSLPAVVLVGSFTTGVVLTVLCALGPAVRGSRVASIAALRDVATDRTGASRWRTLAGAALVIGGLTVVIAGTAGDSLAGAAGGVGLVLVGLSVLGPVLAGPVGRILGAPLRLRGVTGDLARRNAVRNPRRTASSSSALMVGVAVVTLFTVLGASVKASLDAMVDRSFGGDLVVTSVTTETGFDPATAGRMAALDEVTVAAALVDAPIRLGGEDTLVVGSEPAALAAVVDVDERKGDLASLADDEVAVSTDLAAARGWDVGSRVDFERLDGTGGDLEVAVLFAATDLVGDVIVAEDVVAPAGGALTSAVVVSLATGVDPAAGRSAVEAVVADLPTVEVSDRDEFVALVGAQVDQILVLVYGMLALSVLIAVMGIANTLSLSTFERTRELGLLRAVGQLRSQTGAMVRFEAMVVAGFGTALGAAVGVFGAAALVAATDDGALSVLALPAGQLALVLVLGAAAGILAALRPAVRAARLDPLEAIAGA
jgi:putative ABC transport system permease protein